MNWKIEIWLGNRGMPDVHYSKDKPLLDSNVVSFVDSGGNEVILSRCSVHITHLPTPVLNENLRLWGLPLPPS